MIQQAKLMYSPLEKGLGKTNKLIKIQADILKSSNLFDNINEFKQTESILPQN